MVIAAAVNLGFLDLSRCFSSIILVRPSGPRSRSTTSQKAGSSGIEPGTSGSLARNSDH
jgi:hypothetical protein